MGKATAERRKDQLRQRARARRAPGEALLLLATRGGRVKEVAVPTREDPWAESVLERLCELVPRTIERSLAEGRPLSRRERQLLDRHGLPEEPEAASAGLAGMVDEYAQLLARSLDAAHAARPLGVDPSRIRQRLTSRPPTLYGFKHGPAWRLPRFQFTGPGGGEVPGLALVVPRLDPELHPLEVVRWFETPHPDLAPESGSSPLSPLDWLRAGYAPAAVAALASED